VFTVHNIGLKAVGCII